jgi:hypothetical protein
VELEELLSDCEEYVVRVTLRCFLRNANTMRMMGMEKHPSMTSDAPSRPQSKGSIFWKSSASGRRNLWSFLTWTIDEANVLLLFEDNAAKQIRENCVNARLTVGS